MEKLIRNKSRAIFGGVCAGLADYTNADLSLIRLGVVLTAIFTAVIPLLVFYLVAWIIIPDK